MDQKMKPEVKTKKQVKKKNNSKICNFLKYMADRKFSIVWIFLVLCFVISLFGSCSYGWGICRIGLIISLVCFIIFLFHKPLNVVYGLIGTKGHIRTYLILLVVINVIFSLIYQFGFFKNAGITYDINQPYISYGMFKDSQRDSIIHQKGMYVPVFNTEGTPVSYWFQPGADISFQEIRWIDVFKNTLMTSLMQEPSDLFAIASTYNEGVEDSIKGPNDRQKSQLFHTLLILQIFISWIFFGVFISILYNKFRYES